MAIAFQNITSAFNWHWEFFYKLLICQFLLGCFGVVVGFGVICFHTYPMPESNRQLTPYEGGALTIELIGLNWGTAGDPCRSSYLVTSCCLAAQLLCNIAIGRVSILRVMGGGAVVGLAGDAFDLRRSVCRFLLRINLPTVLSAL